MSWFKQKREEIPELPDLPMDNRPVSISDLPNLPDLPDFKISELPQLQTNQNNMKEVIERAEMEKSRFEPLSNFNESETTTIPKISGGYSKQYTKEGKKYEKPYTKEAKPVFIRLDKFEEVGAILHDITEKVNEIEYSLKKVKEIKSREEEELAEWEREIHMIKSKIESIDHNIFKEVD